MAVEAHSVAPIEDNSVSSLLVDLWDTGLYDAVDASMRDEAKSANDQACEQVSSLQEAERPEVVGTRSRTLWSMAFKIRSAVFTVLLIAVVSLVLAMLLNPDMSMSQLAHEMLERVG